MPKVRKTPEAWYVMPTFGEQLSAVLPQVLDIVTRAQRQSVADQQHRAELRAKYAEAVPEIQAQLRQDPVLAQWLTGKRRPTEVDLPPIRPLTQDELTARQLRQVQLQRETFQLEEANQAVLNLRQQYSLTQPKLDALRRVHEALGGKPDAPLTELAESVPNAREQLTLLDFIEAGIGETPEERAKAFVSTRWPEYADQIAQMTAGVGPQIVAARTNDALQWYVDRTGVMDKRGMDYATAVGKLDLTSIQKIADPGFKALAYRTYEEALAEHAAIADRAARSSDEVVGSAALRIVDQSKGRVPLEVARDMAERLMSGEELTGEERALNLDLTKIAADVERTTNQKAEVDLLLQTSGIPQLSALIDLHMKVLSSEHEGENIPKSVVELSRDQLEQHLPELTRRLRQIIYPGGQPAGKPRPDQENYLKGIIQGMWNLGHATTGLAEATGVVSAVPGVTRRRGEPGPARPYREAVALTTRDAVSALRAAGHVVSQQVETAFESVDRRQREHAAKRDVEIGAPPKAEPGGPRKLSPDQVTHLSNVVRELTLQMADPNVALPVKMKIGDVLTLIEEINAGKAPFSELIDRATITP